MPFANPVDKAAFDHQRYLKHKAAVIARSKRSRLENPVRYAYLDQRHTSKQRGVAFELTFEEFEEFWSEGFPARGRGRDDLCMARFGDEGPYQIGNIYVTTNSENKQMPRPLPEPNF